MIDVDEETAHIVLGLIRREMDDLWPDNQEVDHLRALATAVGEDPRSVTPLDQLPRFCSGHVWEPFWRWPYAQGSVVGESRRCTECHLQEVVT